MSLEFTIQNNSGAQERLSVSDVAQQMQQAGEQVLGISADGSTIRLADGQGEFDVKAEDALKQLGWQITSLAPANADYNTVNKEWRAAISALPHDEMRRAYLEGQFRRSGVEHPQIIGGGRDWFAFDPESNQYVALTNNPEWDASDAIEAAVKAPRFIASAAGGAVGGLAGIATGPAAVAAGAAGAGIGGGLADTATRYLLAQNDPVLAETMKGNLGAVAGDILMESGLDAATAGLFGAGALAGRGVKAALNSGPISTALKTAGQFGEAGGRILNKVSRVADKPLGQEMTAMMVPGASELVTLGTLGQLPSQAVRAGVKGMGRLGETRFMQEAAPELATKMRMTSADLMRRAPGRSNFTNEASNLAEETARVFRGDRKAIDPNFRSEKVEDILGNLAASLSGKEYKQLLLNNYKMARGTGLDAKSAFDAAKWNAQAVAQPSYASHQMATQWGKKLGRGLQNVEDFSRGVERMGASVGSGVLKTGRAVGYGVGKTSSTAKMIGTIGQPLENRAYLRLGSEELFSPEIERANPLRRRKIEPRMETFLADNNI